MRYFFFAFFVFFLSENIWSQDIIVREERAVSLMMQDFIEKNKSEETIRGWRIQIITTDDRRAMEKAKTKFKQKYPDMYISWQHVSPYYQVKVGAFENKLQLHAFLPELKKTFPASIPVYDDLKKEELLKDID